MKKIKLYIEEDNGGRAIIVTDDNRFFVSACAPSGFFGDVDIYDGELEEVAAKIRENSGDFVEDIFIDALNGCNGFYEFKCPANDLSLTDSEIVGIIE